MSRRALRSPSAARWRRTPSITILINDSPWLGGFEALVERYEADTGNEVVLNVTPFPGMLQRSRNAVTASESEFDLINLNEQWYSQFYANELVTPIHEIDPDFELDPEVIEYEAATRWDHEIGYSTEDGTLYGLPINGNIQLFFYRQDLFEEAGLDAPVTWDDVEEAAEALHDPPNRFALVNRTSPGNWEFQSYLHSFGGGVIELDEETGQWDVVLNEEPSIEALRRWIEYGERFGPPNYADVGQAELISLMASGRAAMAHMVGAAAPNLEDPDQSLGDRPGRRHRGARPHGGGSRHHVRHLGDGHPAEPAIRAPIGRARVHALRPHLRGPDALRPRRRHPRPAGRVRGARPGGRFRVDAGHGREHPVHQGAAPRRRSAADHRGPHQQRE
ncbi:MAG: extracellular solute-binding protein [Trueperaceae bacterium]|nr:extracellular solute-binding protein [Trueperaceae bacterium]